MKDRLFYPAIALMNRLTYFKKFMLVLGLLAVPCGGLLYLLTSEHDKQIDFTSKEILGIQYNEHLRQFLNALQEHRKYSVSFFFGDTSAAIEMQRKQAEIEQAIARGDVATSIAGDEFSTHESWKNIKMSWRSLKSRAFSNRLDKSEELHSALSKDILSLIVQVADNSNLTLDPDIDSYYLMNLTTAKVLQLAEVVNKSRSLLMSMTTMSLLTPQQRIDFTVQLGVTRSLMNDISEGVRKVYSVNSGIAPYIDPTFIELRSTTDEFVDAVTNEILSGEIPVNRSNYAEVADKSVAASFKVYDAQSRVLAQLLQTRLDSYAQRRLQTLVFTPLVFFLVAYLLMGFYRSVRLSVYSLESVAKQLSSGSMTETVRLSSRDELGQLGQSFNQLAVSLIYRNKQLEESKMLLEASNKQLREAQSALVQGEKMASLGQMVAGIAHEVNTPLGYVKNNIEMMIANQISINEALTKFRLLLDMLVNGQEEGLEQTVEDLADIATRLERDNVLGDIEMMLTQALGGTERIQELIKNLRDFSRLDEADFAKIDINKAIDSTLVIGRSAIKNKAVVRKDYQQNLIAECYPAQFNQVVLNLLVNAAQAIEGEGVITIKTYKEPGDPDMAVIRISDTGKGIPKDHLAKIFEPFFTTKPVGEGTGLGLSIAYKIIEKHGGSLTVSSVVGQGTEFTIKIPVTQRQLSPGQSRAA